MDFPFLTADVRGRSVTRPFVGPEAMARARGFEFKARLGANESAFGPSPKAIAAMTAALGEVWKYADPTNHALRAAIADHLGIPLPSIVVGEGIDGLLASACQLSLEPGATFVMADGSYPTVALHAAIQGADIVKVPYRDGREDLDALLETARARDARVLYVSNPNNPMGTFWRRTEIEALMDTVPTSTLLLLDEAYADTAPPDAIPPVIVGRPNVLRFRTFSKAYGMAGARVGYALGDAGLIGEFDKVRNHYGVNLIGVAGATAAIADQMYLADVVHRVADGRVRIAYIACSEGFEALPSATNFVAIDLKNAAFADRVLDGLLQAGVFIRKPGVSPLDRTIRVTVGTPSQLDLFQEAFHGVLQEVGSVKGDRD